MSLKSIASFVQIASHMDKRARIADGLDVMFDDGTTRRYAPDAFNDIVMASITWAAVRHGGSPVPIIATLGCMYTLALSWRGLCSAVTVEPVAKSPGDIYALMLRYPGDKKVAAIIFDMRHIMPRGMDDASGVVGIPRDGTPLTDCRIMRAFYHHIRDRYQLTDKEEGDLLGSKAMTLTALARWEVKREISGLTYNRRVRGQMRPWTLGRDYALDCARDAPSTYEEYAMRRACMRGGYTFISAREAGKVHGRTYSIDENSAYHAQVMCRNVPECFSPHDPAWLQAAAEKIVARSPRAILSAYHLPFSIFLHVQVEFKGLRLRPGTVFERQEIGLAGTTRLYATTRVAGVDNDSAVEAERGIRDRGYGDKVEGGVYAFAKIMEATSLTTWVTEVELWCMAQAYTWDSMTVIQGEAATKSKRPDDMSILTSMHFWREKMDLKDAIRVEQDDARRAYLRAVYGGEVKPKFNAVGYGLHARDEYRPSWTIDESGAWKLDNPISPETFDDKKPSRPRAWFTYGMRIAAGARMHLILAMQLIWERFGDDARIIAGDTDSLKIRTDLDPQDIISALAPLHDATKVAIDLVTSRAWSLFGERCVDMSGVGEFEVEDDGTYVWFYAPNIKQYCGMDDAGRMELTLSGLPHTGETSYGAWLRQMVERYSPRIVERTFTWGVRISKGVTGLSVIDYGDIGVAEHRLPEFKGVDYTLSDPLEGENWASMQWQARHGRPQSTDGVAIVRWDSDGPVFEYQDGTL